MYSKYTTGQIQPIKAVKGFYFLGEEIWPEHMYTHIEQISQKKGEDDEEKEVEKNKHYICFMLREEEKEEHACTNTHT